MSSRFVALAMKKTARLSRLSGTLPNKRWELNVYIQKREGKKRITDLTTPTPRAKENQLVQSEYVRTNP